VARPAGERGRGDYVQFLAPGIVTMGILFTAVFSGIGPSRTANSAL
jgi:hypothetical protein